MIGARRLVSRIALASVIAIAVAGCHKKVPAAAPAPPPPPTAPATPPRPTPPPPPTPVPAPQPLSDEEIFARKSVDQLNAERPLDDVFFDLDKSEIREDATSALQKDADWSAVSTRCIGPVYWIGTRRITVMPHHAAICFDVSLRNRGHVSSVV